MHFAVKKYINFKNKGECFTLEEHNLCYLNQLGSIMFRFFQAILLVFFICVVLTPITYAQDKKILFREEFNDLKNWRPLYFPKIARHTFYFIEKNGGRSYLKAESNASASALIYKQEFNVLEFPKMHWRWKVDNVYKGTNPELKSGDDYPIRVYIIFKYDSKSASNFEQIKYGLLKKLYGEYPPYSTLSYVWASNDSQKTIITSPYTEKAKVIALEKGDKKVGTWQEEEINILRDYKTAFGNDPPTIASIAIMNDSDDSQQKSTSYIDFIEVFKDEE